MLKPGILADGIRLDQMASRTTLAGRDARFLCSVLEGRGVSISWTFGGQLLKTDSKHRIMTGVAESILTVSNAQQTDSGEYTCIGKTLLSEDRVTASLKVEGVLRSSPEFEHTYPPS